MSETELRPTAGDLLTHTGFVRSLAHAIVRDPAAAEDVAQDAWVTALRNPPRSASSAKAWLRAVVRNLALTRGRSEGRRTAREAKAAPRPDAPSGAETAARLELQREVVTAVLELDEPYRTAIVMRFYDGLGPAEIGRRLGRPANTVSSWIARGLARLRKRLGRQRGSRWVPSALGAFLVSTKLKIAASAVLVLLVGFASWRVLEPEAPSPKPPPETTVPTMPGRSANPVPPPATDPALAGTGAGGGGATAESPDAGAGAGGGVATAPAGWKLRVTVFASDGRPAVGAKVEFRDPGDKTREQGATDEEGEVALEVEGSGYVFVSGVPEHRLAKSDDLTPPASGELELEITLEVRDPFGPTDASAAGGRKAGYSSRGGHRNLQAEGGSAHTQNAVDWGLQWLCDHQDPSGGWSAGDREVETAVTGLALLAFLAGGETHLGGRYTKTLTRGLASLLKRQQGDGSFASGTSGVTNHAIATLAVLEAWGLTGSRKLKASAESGIAHLDRLKGSAIEWEDPTATAWGYFVVVFANRAGLRVPPELLVQAREWVAKEPEDVPPRFPPGSLRARGAAAIFIGSILDHELEAPPWFLSKKNLLRPDVKDPGQLHFGSLAKFQLGGKQWAKWNKGMKNALVKSQRRDGDEKGSWDPKYGEGKLLGRAGVTALHVTTLETYYRFTRVLSGKGR